MSDPNRPDALLAVVLATDVPARSPFAERDRQQALRDLHAIAHFAPVGLSGPFRLHLGLDNGRLVLDVRDRDDTPLHACVLSLTPFRRLLKDYQMIVDSYDDAVAGHVPGRLQAIDMARRGVHDEAASVLVDRLAHRIEIDHETARRLFTLVSILTQRL